MDHEQTAKSVLKEMQDSDPSKVVCPSGLTIRLRKLTLDEMEELGDRKAVQSGEAYERILTNCTTHTDDYGPAYAGKAFSWGEALQGDVFAALLGLRRLTHGDTMMFDLQCPACRRMINWPVDLATLLVKNYPTEALRKHATNEMFTAKVGDATVSYKLMTRRMERAMQKAIQQDKKKMTASWTFRIIRVDGAGLKDPTDKAEIRPWVSKMDADAALELREGVEAMTGGVDTTLTVECPYESDCGHIQEVELPLGAPAFWAPKKRPSNAAGQPEKKAE